MATLTTEQRKEAWAEMMRLGGISITKDDLLAAFNAIDDFFEANTTINNGDAAPSFQAAQLTFTLA
jgi:hypothetical protein